MNTIIIIIVSETAKGEIGQVLLLFGSFGKHIFLGCLWWRQPGYTFLENQGYISFIYLAYR